MKYTGGCHCGEVQYEVELGEIKELLSCNCSICSKSGWLLLFAPDSNFKLLKGEKFLTDYQFGKKNIHHLFCSKCGVRSFSLGANPSTGEKMRAINARCLNDFNIEAYPLRKVDGKNF